MLALVPLLSNAQSAEKAYARRSEATGLVEQILAGQNVQQALSRLRFSGQEQYAAKALMDQHDAVDPRVRRNVAFALADLAVPRSEPALVAMARDEDATVRMSAAQGLGRLRTKNLGALRPLLADPNLGVRAKAAWSMGQTRSPRAVKALLSAVHAEGEPEVRAVLLVSLGQTGNEEIVPDLERYLTSKSELTRVAAAQALCLLGAPSGRAYARKLLASKDKYERRQGLALFEGASARSARPVLKPLLEDPEPSMQAAAARILFEGGDASMRDWLVLASYRAPLKDKLAYEAELDKLHLTDAQRKAILSRAGVK